MNRNIIINDKIAMADQKATSHPSGLWARTEILFGHDRYTDKNGVSQLGEVVFKTENMVLLGGVQYAMEKIFNVAGPISTGYLNDSGYGSQSTTLVPSGQVYPATHSVVLFGVGIGGAGANTVSAFDVSYHELGLTNMVPFRYTNTPLTSTEETKYFGRKVVDLVPAYYLKSFDNPPTITHLWKDGVDGADGSEVDSTVFASSRTDGIQTFTEILMTITKTDLKEWFAANGNIEDTRINEVALFTGVYNAEDNDYEKIKCFSKLNIPTEPLSLSKDMNIIYRVFGS